MRLITFSSKVLGRINDLISKMNKILSITFKYIEDKYFSPFLLEILPLTFLFTYM